MTVKGGNTTDLYQGDGRLKMAKSLERMWPGVVKTTRKYKHAQHVIYDNWTRFDTPLKLKSGIDLSMIEDNEYGLQLNAIEPIKSDYLKQLMLEQKK